MSSGQGRVKVGFNKTQIKNGKVVIVQKDGRIRGYKDPETVKVVKDKR